jgi:hypothetical protein
MMKIISILMILGLCSSCAVVPTLGLSKKEYCVREGKNIRCSEGNYRIGNAPPPYPEDTCGIYDTDCVIQQ